MGGSIGKEASIVNRESLCYPTLSLAVNPKQRLRQQLLRRLLKQPKRRRLIKSLEIGRALRRLRIYRKAKILLCYIAIHEEVETRPIIAKALSQGKRVAVPVVRAQGRRLLAVEIKDPDRDLKVVGPYGIPQPAIRAQRRVVPEDLDLIIVPGVAFDRSGRRLGRGLGYFDRFLESVPSAVPRVGLAFRFQLVKRIPWESHDQPVTRVITD